MFKRILSTLLVLVTLLSFLPPKAAAQESAPQVAGDVTVEGTNSFGTLLANTVQNDPQTQSETQVNRICDLQFNGSLATVEYTSIQAARLVVAVYTEDGRKMLGSGTLEVSPEDTLADVEIEIGTMPRYYSAAAYLLDSKTNDPLSPEFRTQLYTKTVQDIKNSTVADYDPERVLNLDDDNTTNFAVFGENTILVREDSQVQITGGNGVYTVTNADERFLAMQPGDSFAMPQEGGDYLIVKAARVSVKGDTVTIYENADADLSDVFDVVKIEGQSTDDNVTYDDSNLDSELSVISEEEYSLESDEIEVYAKDTDESKSFTKDFKSEGEHFYGVFELKLAASTKAYISPRYQYIAIDLTFSMTGKITVEAKFSKDPELGVFGVAICPGCYLQIVPKAYFSASCALTYQINWEACIVGSTYDSDTGTWQDTRGPSRVESSVDFSGSIYVGIGVKATVAFVSKELVNVAIEAQGGATVSGSENIAALSTSSDSVLHPCKICIDGKIEGSLKTSLSYKLFMKEETIGDLEKTWKISDFYYCADEKEFGFTKCPHKVFRVELTAQDAGSGPVENAWIRLLDSEGSEMTPVTLVDKDGAYTGDIPSTDEKGKTTFYLPNGEYTLEAIKDGQCGARDFTVHEEAKKLSVRLDVQSGGNAIQMVPETLSLEKRDQSQLKVFFGIDLQTQDITNDCTWSSGQPKVATVDKGKVTAVGPGTARVIASYTKDGKRYLAKCDVVVKGVTIASGSCGDNLTWNLTEDGALIIFGSGEMKDYSSNYQNGAYRTNAPWGTYWKEITAVVIESGVTSIGNCAFSGCSSLTSVMIPDSVTRIGDKAFESCDSLTSVTIPKSVTSIGIAFVICKKLSSIVIDVENANYTSINGIIFNKNCTNLLLYPAGKKDSAYEVPAGVTSIGEYAFYYCSSLTSVTIPKGVTQIGECAFEGCSGLTSVTIPKGVTSINGGAFFGCSSLTSVTIPESVTSIGDYAFDGCRSLASVTIPEGVTSIGVSVFCGCSRLTSVMIPESVTSIGAWAFEGCASLTSITIPESVTNIGGSAFESCGRLTNVYYGGTEAQWNRVNIDSSNTPLLSATIHFSDGTTSQSVLEEPEETLVTEPTMETIPVTNPTEEPVPATTAETIPETIPETTTETTAEAIPETTSESVEPETAQESEESLQEVSAMNWWRVPQGAKLEEGTAVPLSAHTGRETVKNGVRSVAFVGLEPGEEYVLIVSLRTGSVQPTDLQYIEQSTADGNGKASFTYIPRTDVSAITQLYGISAQRAITLDREYLSIPMGSLSEPIRATVDPEEWADSLVWSSENEDIVSVDEQGYVTPVAPGTGYVLATVTHGKYTLTARCRVDVTEKPANEEVLGVDLGLTKVTSELYSRNYASLDVLLRLEQNEISTFAEENQVTDNGVAITGAFLEDEDARQVFDLKVKDDRHLLLVPTQAAIDGTVPVSKKMTSRVVVEVNGVEYHTEDAVTVTVGKTLPKLKAQNVTFNSFYTDQSQALSITGGTVTKVENNGQWPDWLTLDGTKLTLNNAPAKGSASLNLLVSTEEWAVPVPMKVTAKLAYKAPAFRLSASRMTIPVFTKPDDNGDTAGTVWVQLLCKRKTDTLESLNVAGIRAPEGWSTEAEWDSAADGWFALKPNPGTRVQAGKLTLNVCFSDTKATVPLTVSVKPQATPLTVSLYQPTVKYTLNSTVADGFFEPWYLGSRYMNNCQPTWSILDKAGQDVTDNFEIYLADDGRIAVLTDPATVVPGNYRLCVDLERDGAIITEKTAVRNFTVLPATKKPSVTLKAGAPMDISFPDPQTDVTFAGNNYFLNRFENYNELEDQAEFYDAKGNALQGCFQFARDEETNRWYIRPVSEVPAGSYQMKLNLILDSNSENGEVPCTVKFTVKRTPIKLKLSQSKLSLNKAVMDSAVVDVNCKTKGYTMGQPVITAPEEITAEYRDGKLYLAVNDQTTYGTSYAVTVKAAENQPEAVLAVTIPAQAASNVTVSAKASGFIDVIRDSSEIVVTPSYKNYWGLTAIDKTARIFWAKDGKNFTEDVTAAFRLSWDESGRLHLQRAGNLELTGKYRLELAVQGAQKPALVNLTLKSGTAKVTAAPVVLYAKDANTRAELKFANQEAGLNPISRAEARSGEYTIENLSHGGFAIRPTPGKTLKSGKVSLNLFFEGNTTTKPNATVNLSVEIR